MKKEKIGIERSYTDAEKKALSQLVQAYTDIKKGVHSFVELPMEISKITIELIEQNSRIYPLVNKFFPIEPGRIIIGNDVTEAEFLGSNESANAQDYEVRLEFNFRYGFKLVKVIFIDDDFMMDNESQFQAELLYQIAMAFALGLDNAILNGKGEELSQIQGIIPNIPESNKISLSASNLAELLQPIGLIDSGKYNEGEVYAIVNRDTYYKKILKLLINCSNPSCLPRFIISYAMPVNQILYADFEKYMLIRRGNFSMERTTHNRFLLDQTGYKGRMNFDGKPSRKQAFSLVTLE